MGSPGALRRTARAPQEACAATCPGCRSGMGGTVARSVTAFRNFTEAISRLSISSVVFVWMTAWINSSGTAVIRPKAVQFIATEMLADSRLAFSAGFTVATAANALMRPTTVPSSPSSVATFANVATPRGADAGQTVVEDLADGGVRLGSHLHGLTEVALRQQRGHLAPQPPIAQGGVRQVDPALDRDADAQHQHHGDRIHHESAALKEAHNVIEDIHPAASHPSGTMIRRILKLWCTRRLIPRPISHPAEPRPQAALPAPQAVTRPMRWPPAGRRSSCFAARRRCDPPG